MQKASIVKVSSISVIRNKMSFNKFGFWKHIVISVNQDG